jgi:C4-dicarboxylate-specific signal transduction histidine kinase
MLDQERLPASLANLREILTDIHDQSLDTATVIERLRMMTRREAFELELLEIDEVVRGLTILIAGEARARRVRLDLELGAEAVKIRADRVCLRQVILNLLLNALDAVEQVDHERLIVARTRQAGNMVELTVSDNGPGVSPQHAAKIFDTFFTTKKSGVGLGLALSRSLAEAQGGRLALAETNDRGATFSFTLPAMSMGAEA